MKLDLLAGEDLPKRFTRGMSRPHCFTALTNARVVRVSTREHAVCSEHAVPSAALLGAVRTRRGRVFARLLLRSTHSRVSRNRPRIRLACKPFYYRYHLVRRVVGP